MKKLILICLMTIPLFALSSSCGGGDEVTPNPPTTGGGNDTGGGGKEEAPTLSLSTNDSHVTVDGNINPAVTIRIKASKAMTEDTKVSFSSGGKIDFFNGSSVILKKGSKSGSNTGRILSGNLPAGSYTISVTASSKLKFTNSSVTIGIDRWF